MKNLIETVMGAVVLTVAVFFVYTAVNSSGVQDQGGYSLTANFEKSDGVGVGSDVRISGIKVGTIIGQSLNPETYEAELVLSLKDEVKVPADTTAEIVSESLLGGKYINLVPGAEEYMLSNGDAIAYTQSSINLEQLIGKFAFGSAEE